MAVPVQRREPESSRMSATLLRWSAHPSPKAHSTLMLHSPESLKSDKWHTGERTSGIAGSAQVRIHIAQSNHGCHAECSLTDPVKGAAMHDIAKTIT